MKVRLEDIPPEGLEVSFSDGRIVAGELGSQVCEISRRPLARLKLTRQGGTVRAKGGFTAGMRLVCSRCLEEMDYELQGGLDMVFLPRSREHRAPSEEVSLDQEDLDVIFYDGEVLDLGQSLADEVSLAVPMAPLCREDCLGLCPSCGKNLKDGPCGCEEGEIDPRWAKLAELKES